MSGGNVIISAGRFPAAGANRVAIENITNSIVFTDHGGAEALRFDPSGDVFVRGTRVDSDVAIYDMFREWLLRAVTVQRDGEFGISS